ncbi:MAG: hypothetical protein WBE38_07285 [Terracidiphilus sp.]
MFGTYEGALERRPGHRKWIVIAACSCLLVAAMHFLLIKLSHGVMALRSGMNSQDVIEALGEPNCTYKDTWHELDLPLPGSSSLIYRESANALLAVEFDDRGIIYGRTLLAFRGPLAAEQACQSAATAILQLDMARTKTFSDFLPNGSLENFDVKEHHPY